MYRFNSGNISHNIKSPCKDCADRYVGCQGKCGAYAGYKNEILEFSNARLKFNSECKAVNDVLCGTTYKRF